MLFSLRSAFVQTLQAKAVLELAKADLEYYDKIIAISQARFKDGDLAQVDLDRIELLRVQYESEIETATVNLRTQKIQLIQLLDDRTPVDQFDVTGPFDFSSDLKPLTDFEQAAMDARPDLRAAVQSIEQAKTNHKLAIANGSTDPTFGAGTPTTRRITTRTVSDIGFECIDTAPHLRSQSGREAAHAHRHRPQPATDRCRAGTGLQRCRFGLRAGAK